MPTDRARRVMITVNDSIFAAAGLDPSASGAVEVTAALARLGRLLDGASRAVARKLTRDEWCYLADACNGTLWDWANPTALVLAANAEDAQALDGLGAKWFGDADSAPRAVAALVAKLSKLSLVEADAVALAIAWFWRHCEDIDITEDAWWLPAFRERSVIGE